MKSKTRTADSKSTKHHSIKTKIKDSHAHTARLKTKRKLQFTLYALDRQNKR